MLRPVAIPQSRPPLQLMTLIPVQKSSKQETFTALCHDFNIDEKVLQLLLDSPMDNLEEVRCYIHKEEQIDNFVAQDKDLKDAGLRIQAARVRRALSAARVVGTEREEGPTSTLT
eukprot:12420249-Karenia_brevis.AAC.1